MNTLDRLDTGSPPRMRGKPPSPTAISFRQGITPAYAGKTVNGAIRANRIQDHPRVCGENPHSNFCPA